MQLSGLDSWISSCRSGYVQFDLWKFRFNFDSSLCGNLSPFVALFCFFLKHPLRQQLAQTMLLVPFVICCKFLASGNLSVAANLQLVEMGQMTFGTHMSEKM
jgi:hypothetical protein